MTSAFGVDHGDEVSKGIKDSLGTAKLVVRANKQSYKLARLHGKKAKTEAGYSSGFKGFKEGVSAGLKGNAKVYNQGAKEALGVARNRTGRDLAIAQRRRGPATFSESMNDSIGISGARFKRKVSEL
jgi:hypothetical protein